LFDDAVAEVIIKLVSNSKFTSLIQEKINMKVDTSAIENEIDNYQKELRKSHSTKFKLIDEIDNLDVEDKHYKRRKNDLDDSLYRMYDTIEELEGQLIEALIAEIQIYEEKQPNGQWLKSITFKFPIIDEDLNIDLDNNEQVECIALLVRYEATAK